MMCAGMDLSKRKRRAAVVDRDGVLVDEFSFSNDFEGIKRLFLSFRRATRML